MGSTPSPSVYQELSFAKRFAALSMKRFAAAAEPLLPLTVVPSLLW
jgi:hypothetical protein